MSKRIVEKTQNVLVLRGNCVVIVVDSTDSRQYG